MRAGVGVLLAGLLLTAWRPVVAQEIDLSHGGPVEITARDGLDWHQAEQTVIAHGDARAVRGDVTVLADRLIAYYRRKAGAAAPPVKPASAVAPTGIPGAADDTGGSEIYRLEAQGHVRIYTTTDRATAEHGVYDIDQAVMVLTGNNLRLTTPSQLITARDSLEYWSAKHMAVARGDAVITTTDGRQLSADTVVAYMTNSDAHAPGSADQAAAKPDKATPDPAKAGSADATTQQGGKLERAEAYGSVLIRTATQTVRGDRGVYLPQSGLARLVGNARLTQGANQVNGADLEVDLNTGIYRLLSAPGQRVEGLVVPNDSSAPTPGSTGAPAAAKP